MRTPNTTFDVYLAGRLPPAAPDVAGLTGYLQERWQQGNERNEGDRTFFWTATLDVPLGTNLPDLYPGGASQTTAWFPDSTGDAYTIVFVERIRDVRGGDFLRAYLVKGYVVAITIEEADGTPTLTGVTTLIVDQADGFQLSQPAVNQARLDLLTQLSITADASGIKLVNDAASPGNSKYYGTDGSGTRGWYALPTGTVTSVGLSLPSIFSVSGSPVTTSGTLTGSLASQSANTVFAGPTSGGAAAPTFRALVAADLPLFSSSAKGAVPASGGGTSNFLRADGSWAAPSSGSGTVTSVGLSMPGEFSVSGSPVTTSGTITVSKANQTANFVYAGPTSGGAAAPTFRHLDVNDMPTQGSVGGLTDATGGTAGSQVNDVGTSFSQTTLNSNFATITRKINDLLTQLKNFKAIT